jgi:hypothetical protein
VAYVCKLGIGALGEHWRRVERREELAQARVVAQVEAAH